MENNDDKPATVPDNDDPGRSRERERQDELLDRAARQESWVSRLRRWNRDKTGRPRPGNPDRPNHRT